MLTVTIILEMFSEYRVPAECGKAWHNYVSNLTWISLEVGIHKSLMVSVDGPGHAWPGLGEAQSSRDIATLYNIPLQTRETCM